MLADNFRTKKKAYLKAKIEELETNSKLKNVRDMYRGVNDFKKIKYEMGGACSAYGGEERCVQGFGGET
jgi:Txe/YoeB family toxin of Txe-Axe toxin-antitoxin module